MNTLSQTSHMTSLKFGFCGFTQEQLEHNPVLRLSSITVFFPIFVNLITTYTIFLVFINKEDYPQHPPSPNLKPKLFKKPLYPLSISSNWLISA